MGRADLELKKADMSFNDSIPVVMEEDLNGTTARLCAHEPVEVSFGCIGLPPFELTGSCPSVFGVLWLYSQRTRRWQEHGRTEVVRHGDDPQFARSFYLEYAANNDPLTYSVTDQWLRLEVYMRASTLPNLSNHTLIGQAKFALREVYRTPIKRRIMPLVQKNKGGSTPEPAVSPGKLVVRVSSVGDTSGYVELHAKCQRLQEAGASRGADTFLTVSRYCNGHFEVVHRTPKIQNSLEPKYELFEASIHRLCLNDPDVYIMLAVWNDEKDGRHTLLGLAVTCLTDIRATRPEPKLGEPPLPGDTPVIVHFPLVPSCDPQKDGLTEPIQPSGPRRRLPKVASISVKLTFHTAGTTGQQSVAALEQSAGSDASAGREAAGDRSPDGNAAASLPAQPAPSPKSMAGMSQFSDDLDFLHKLLGEDLIKNSDVKDIVGDGIRFLNEKQAEFENAEAKAAALIAPSPENPYGLEERQRRRDRRRAARAAKDKAGEGVNRVAGSFLDASPPRDTSKKLVVRKQRRLGKGGGGGATAAATRRASGVGAMGERGGGVLERARAYLDATGERAGAVGADHQAAAVRSYLRDSTDDTAKNSRKPPPAAAQYPTTPVDSDGDDVDDDDDDDESLIGGSGGAGLAGYPVDSDDEDDEEARRDEEELRRLKQQHAKYAPPLRDAMLPHGSGKRARDSPPPRPSSLPALGGAGKTPAAAAGHRRASERRAKSQMGVVIKGAGGHGVGHHGKGQKIGAGSKHGKNLRLNVTAKFKQLSALH